MTDQTTVFLVDDDDSMRKSATLVLSAAGFQCRPYDSAAAFLQDFDPAAPGCLVLDLHMAGMNGLELLERLRADGVALPVIIVSGTGTIPSAVKGMKLGVEDFLEKPVHPDVLTQKVRDAIAKDTARRAETASIEPIRRRFGTLTAREREILTHIVEGLPNKLIAREMSISIKTVENHRARLVSKMEALNTADLVRMHMLLQSQPAMA
ncbi:MAG: response regulator [Tepidisphaeraceae bacterium]